VPPKVKARTKTTQPRPVRTITIFLLVMAALTGLMFLPGVDAKEPRLGLDLAGGSQVTLLPRQVCPDGAVTCPVKAIPGSQLDEAVGIIRQRINGSGVTEADVQTQGSNIVVSVPGATGQEALEQIATTALVRFRKVLQAAAPVPSAEPPPANPLLINPAPIDAFDNSDPTGAGPALTAAFAQLDCTDPNARRSSVSKPGTAAIVACEREGTEKYLLGPELIAGERISGASSGIPSGGGKPQVNLEFDGKGAAQFSDITQELSASNGRFAIALDDNVISAPTVSQRIDGGRAQITGNFTLKEADTLAQVLKFGQLPVAFDTGEVLQVSATVGRDQLEKGLLAGGIGLVLVVVYSMLFYRALGLVSILSLVVAGALTYISCSLLGEAIGFALILAGVIGVIVSIGITADSFVVYFERVRDEIREGRPIRTAVEKAWPRARRTILVADAVTFLAALVLYFLSIGRVQNFAFTLGLTTVIDVIVVFFFTKPLVTLLVRRPFFRDGHKLSGLNPASVGAKPRRAPLSARVGDPVGENA
jgi:preprotein translocase subunit SecD